MDFHQLKQDLIAYCDEINVQKIGFASADTFETLKERLMTQQSLQYHSGFEKGSIEERTTPTMLQPQAKSIIAIALAYPSKLQEAPKNQKGARRGQFARASWGRDYHDVLREKLNQIGAFLEARMGDVTYTSMVDTGELNDRAVAERAGIGFVGKNSTLITEEYGSYVYLGEMITNIPFEPDEPLEEGCGDCNICVDTCPTGALVQGGQLNASQCIAYQTLTKDYLGDEFRSKIGNRLYGCDTCQVVCPKNKGVDFHVHPEFEPDPERVKPKLEPLLTMSNREFKATFGEMAGSWRGKKPIQRNAIIALANFKETSAVDTLNHVMQHDPRPMIRGTAGWAIGQIARDDSQMLIEDALKRESDNGARQEMEKGLSAFMEKVGD